MSRSKCETGCVSILQQQEIADDFDSNATTVRASSRDRKPSPELPLALLDVLLAEATGRFKVTFVALAAT